MKTPDRAAFFDMADRLLQCVEAQLADTQGGPPERACVVVGSDLVWDDCECGLLAVQMIRDFPSDNFPIIKQDGPFNRCDVRWTVVEYHVSILRCVPSSQDTGEPPACVDMQQAAMIDFEDRWAVLRGTECCLAAMRDTNPALPPYLVGEQVALGEGGLCAGSQLTVFVAMPNCVEC